MNEFQQIGFIKRAQQYGLSNVEISILLKTASDIKMLREAKRRSDNHDYKGKTKIIKTLMARKPAEWRVDSIPKNGVVGITHKPTGFQYHLPAKLVDINKR